MTYIYVPPGGGVWPPAGQPIGSYDTYAEARRAAGALAQEDIPAQDLTVLSVMGWRSAGDRLAVLSGTYVTVFAVLALALGVASGGPLIIWALVAAGLVGLALGVVVAVGTYFRRRTRRFLDSFDPPVVGRHVLLCAPRTAQRARNLLTGLRS